MIHAAVLQAWDRDDGVRDGVIGNPPACAFDYGSLTCTGADAPDCLTPAQVASAKTMTSAFRDPATGRMLLEPHLWPGSELQWATLGGSEPLANSLSRVRRFHLKDPAWEFRVENVAADVERAARMDGGLLASDTFDLRPFFGRGGKLLMWHGWSDQQVPAENSVIYHDNVLKSVGPAAHSSIALFMLPGVLHCGGGPGPDTFDRMGAIAGWVESGLMPAVLTASKVEKGETVQTRPLCAYPNVARYLGSGDSRDAGNFACVAPSPRGGR